MCKLKFIIIKQLSIHESCLKTNLFKQIHRYTFFQKRIIFLRSIKSHTIFENSKQVCLLKVDSATGLKIIQRLIG